MNSERWSELIATHEHFPAVVAPLVTGYALTTLRDRSEAGKWSPLEILAHLRDEEREDFWPRAKAVVDGRPIEQGIDPAGWVTARAYNEMDPAEVLADFTRLRDAAVVWLRSLDRDHLDRAIDHPKLGRMRAGDFIAAWRMHDLLHLRQLATTLARLEAKRLDGWRVEYAGTIPA